MQVKKLLAGVAVLAMVSGVAHAGVIYQGSVTTQVPILGPVTSNNAIAVGIADLTNPGVTSGTSLITISGSSAGNNGTASNTDGATFTLKGSVTPDCAYYSGSADTNVDFGAIGIYASDNTGPANAFDMTAPANVQINTNLAGCNTANTVSINKGDIRGMVNNSGVGYDANVFQANLPYNVTATYTAGAVGSTAGVAGAADHIFVANNANAGTATHGAWKSAMLVKINVPVAAKSLLAGNYADTLKVEIKAN
jgi:hypothetical protein